MSRPVLTAAAISRTLREAGVPKASAYRSFGREQDGFMVSKASPYGPQDEIAAVHVTAHYDAGRVMCERVVEVLRGAGYTVRERKNNGKGGTYAVDVVEPDQGPTEEEYRAALEAHWAEKAARALGDADEEFNPADDAYEADDPKRLAF